MNSKLAKRQIASEDDVIAYAREVLRSESDAIKSLIGTLGQPFVAAVSAIHALPAQNRVIVSGIGKAGFIAMKISATLASIGTPSFFLHPAEAVHGDLGRYTTGDIALFISNSGETEEILRIIPQIKKIGCLIISITGSSSSKLALQSDLSLLVGEIKEAGPLGLAPTTSTTAMLALGDALTMSVLERRGITDEQFALFHPGGNLGRSLMPISEIMRSGDAHCIVSEDTKTRDVLHKITATKGRPGAASIVDKSGKLAGIFTDGDLRRCLDQDNHFLDLPVKNVMGKNPRSISSLKLARDALALMTEFKIDQVIVVNDDREPVGMLDIQDLVAD